MVHLFDNFDDIDSETYKKMYDLLPTSRKAKVLQREGIDQKIAIIEYFLLKKILNFENYPDFKYSKNGKPLLDGYHFSIAHCENTLCIATADVEVGVDIEKLHPYQPDIARFVLNDVEFARVQKSKNKDLAFTKFFVQKEATIKCLGRAICDIKDILTTGDFCYHFKHYKDFLICECLKK